MSDQRDIIIKEIQEKLKKNLAAADNKQKIKYIYQKVDMYENQNINDTYRTLFISKVINYCLRYKKVVKKIPILGWYSKKVYHSNVLIGSREQNSLTRTTDTTRRFKLIRCYSRKIPILGFILWWVYMLIMAPKKLNRLYIDLTLVKNETGIFTKKILKIEEDLLSLNYLEKNIKSDVKDIFKQLAKLNNNNEYIQSEMIEVTSKVNDSIATLKLDKSLGLDWNKFYSDVVTKEYLESNIEHHKYFIDLIQNFAISASQDEIPKLIEIGIGTATMSIYFSYHLFEVLGIDLEPLIVAKATQTNKNLGGHANFISTDIMYLPYIFKPKIFDVSFSQGTMEHFDNKELKLILEAQLYIAKYVVLSVPSVNWHTLDYGDERKMTIEEWKTLLTNFGLTLKHLSYYQENNSHIAIILSN